MAERPIRPHTKNVTGVETVLFPGIALLVVGCLALLLRWTFGRGGSVVTRQARPGPPGDYGLLIPIAIPRSAEEAVALEARLARIGIRVNVAETADGTRLMVFPADFDRAREELEKPTT